MAMVRVCDACGNPVTPPHKQLKVNEFAEDTTAPRDAKTIRSIDMHDRCYVGFTEWLRRTHEASQEMAAPPVVKLAAHE